MLRGSSSIAHVALSKSTYVDDMPFLGGGSWLRGLTRREPLRASANPRGAAGVGELDRAAAHTVAVIHAAS
jgi:hypothetical protein